MPSFSSLTAQDIISVAESVTEDRTRPGCFILKPPAVLVYIAEAKRFVKVVEVDVTGNYPNTILVPELEYWYPLKYFRFPTPKEKAKLERDKKAEAKKNVL